MSPEEVARQFLSVNNPIGQRLQFNLGRILRMDLEKALVELIREDRQRQELEKDPSRDR